MTMRRRIQVGVVVLGLLLVAGLVVIWVQRTREAAALIRCRNNLKQLTIALWNYHGTDGVYPCGTATGTSLPPERRLSWYVELRPYIEGGCDFWFDPQKPWDDEVNQWPGTRCKEDPPARTIIRREQWERGDWPVFICSSNPHRAGPGVPGLTHYVGVAGVGAEAATWPLEHPGVGLFGYDRSVRWSDVRDGSSTTIALIETARDNGPWLAGGPPTVRGLDPDGPPYLGEGGQFTSFHRLVNVAFLDGSVRPLAPSVDPRVLEALATIASGEQVGPLGDD
jgi:prepilin-type processing-associated H-X9-DG protein